MTFTARQKVNIIFRAVLLTLLMLYPSVVLATTVSGSSAAVSFSNTPWGVTSVKVAAPGGAITMSAELTVYAKEVFPDGDYQYELIGELPLSETSNKVTDDPANGRDNVTLKKPVGVIESGDFRIVNGVVFDARTQQEN